MSNTRKRYALVGTGGRAQMFIDAIARDYAEWNELVALCDLSQTRMDFHNTRLADVHDAPPLPTYHADDFDRMIAETKPDVVIDFDGFHPPHLYLPGNGAGLRRYFREADDD